MDTSKIIKGAVSNGRYTVTAPIVKEDYGLYLQIEGVELPSTYEVDFSNSEHNGTSVTMIGNSDGVLIPHQFIDTGKDVFAFLYHVGEDFGRTVYKFRIPNKVRPDRTNEEPTPEEQSLIDQTISALNTAVTKTAQDVISADQSAQSAQGYAEQAETAKDTAQTYANNAQTSATSAQTSASQASTSATASAESASASAQIKADVEDLVDDAQSYAESALIASQASVTARNTAQGYANSASASAQSASTSASNASASANTASSKATEASTSAQTASTKATEASQSASQASGYAQTAETAKTDAQTAKTQADTARDEAVTAKTAAETAQGKAEDAQAAAESVAESIPSDYSQLSEDVSDLKEELNAITDAIIQPVAGANKLNPDTMTAGYRVANDGTITESSTITVSDYIEIPTGVTYALGCARYNPSKPNSWSFSYGRMAFYDASKVFISPWYNSTTSAVQIPTGAKYVRVDFPIAYSNMYMGFSNGASLPTYEEYGVTYENIALVRVEEVEGEVGTLDERVTALEDGANGNVAKLALPSNYDLVVGDTFQLFFKGIVNTVYPENYYVIVQCSKGNLYERFFEITPTTAETLTMTVTLYDSNKNLIDSKNVTLTVRNKATSPSSQKNILCVGNSLTTGGEWVTELHRRLTGTGGTPTGDGLSNINFIGTRVANNIHYEGYGGWAYNSYNTENVSNNSKVITCNHDKGQNDQHSIYQASNGSQWKLETIVTGQIKIMLVSGVSSTFPATGTLTWVSGGVNHSDIVYTASANSAGNPFWDSNANKVDFAKYATSQGVSSIDYVYVLLGWNQASQAEATFKESVQTFINNVHASFPNAKVVLLGLEVPARDGLGVNYGATSIFSRYYDLLQFVFNVDKWYADLAESNTNVASVNISGQFDSIHNMITSTRQVNSRNTETEVYQSNGIHPATSGYMQIADAAYRDITARL